MPLRLTRLQISDQIIAGSSTPTQQFLRYFNKALESIENAVNGLTDALVAIAAAQTAADEANTALENGAILVKDEGAGGGETHTIDFVGAGVSAAVAAGVATVTVPGGAGALALIASQTVSGTSVASVTFSSIPATYHDLILVCRSRGAAVLAAVNLQMRFNNDSTANYDQNIISGANNAMADTVSLAQTVLHLGATSAASAVNTNRFGVATVEIIEYASTVHEKDITASSNDNASHTAATSRRHLSGGTWRSAAAIDRIDLLMSSGNIDVNSTFTLYGRG